MRCAARRRAAFAADHTPAEASRKARGLVEKADPAEAERRRIHAIAMSDVDIMDDVDGQSILSARMSTPDAHAILAAINGLAQDDRFAADGACAVGQRRIEALKALVLSGAGPAGGDLVAAARVTAHIGVVVSLEAMLGVSDEPGMLAGSGPISASAAREVITACSPDSTLYRLVVDPDGALLDVGRQRYAVSDIQRRFVAARDVTCRFPGCAARAVRCQIDHAVPWDDGGRTDIANLGNSKYILLSQGALRQSRYAHHA